MGWNIHSGRTEEGLEGGEAKKKAGDAYYAFAL
jgi:hypothetical protein